MMSPTLVFVILFAYFLLLIMLSYFTGRNSNSDAFFSGNHASPWYLVAFGMVGASLSGVTFISVPGQVNVQGFAYLQFVLGNFVGYWLIAEVLLPLYYRNKVTSIYELIAQRLGRVSHRTASVAFVVSQLIGASFRMFLAVMVLQMAFFDPVGIPFPVTVAIMILMIYAYTFRSGIKTIVWTDTLQTACMLVAVFVTLFYIKAHLSMSFGELWAGASGQGYTQLWDWQWQSATFFPKQFFAGIFITIVMVGLDQNMMQKNLTCKDLPSAQKNMRWFSISFLISCAFFLFTGACLYLYAIDAGLPFPEKGDQLFPMLALQYMPMGVSIAFLLGIIASAYSSADSSLTALTTSVCIDWFDKKQPTKRFRTVVHVSLSVLMWLVIVVFDAVQNQSVVTAVFKVAGYTYGPLLGMFCFAFFFKERSLPAWATPVASILAPLICWVISTNSQQWFRGYQFGFELLILNGGLMVGLLALFNRLASISSTDFTD